MRTRDLIVLAFVAVATVSRASQTTSSLPRTADGRPDLQGYWDNSISTPLERGRRFIDKEFYTEQDVADLENPDDTATALKRSA